MMDLTDDERKALDRYRLRHERKAYPEYVDDLKLLADIAERDRPVRSYGDLVIRWDDPITPERLVACGFILSDFCVACCGLAFYPLEGRWWSDGTVIPRGVVPRNMGEVWNLMERCGIKESGE